MVRVKSREGFVFECEHAGSKSQLVDLMFDLNRDANCRCLVLSELIHVFLNYVAVFRFVGCACDRFYCSLFSLSSHALAPKGYCMYSEIPKWMKFRLSGSLQSRVGPKSVSMDACSILESPGTLKIPRIIQNECSKFE